MRKKVVLPPSVALQILREDLGLPLVDRWVVEEVLPNYSDEYLGHTYTYDRVLDRRWEECDTRDEAERLMDTLEPEHDDTELRVVHEKSVWDGKRWSVRRIRE